MTEVAFNSTVNVDSLDACSQLKESRSLLTALISHNQNSRTGAESFRIEDLQRHQVLGEGLEIRDFVALGAEKKKKTFTKRGSVCAPLDVVKRTANKLIIQINCGTLNRTSTLLSLI